jgi:cytochrome c biogenesis protein ResB
MSDQHFQEYITDQEPKAAKTAKKKQSLWDLLSTMKFAIWLLILLGALSLLSMFAGELLPKEQIAKTGQGFGRALIDLFQMGDPFRSWWYRLLLGLLCLSLLACILNRFPTIWRLWTKKPPQDAAWLKNVRFSIVRDVKTSREDLTARFSPIWGWRVKTDQLWIGEYGRIGMWGPITMHIGLLLIGIGALGGSFGGITLTAGGFAGESITGKDVPTMPFDVRIDSFRIQYYPLQPGQMVLVEETWVGRLLKKQPDGSWMIEQRGEDGTMQSVSANEFDIRNQFDGQMDRSNIKKFSSWVTVVENGQDVAKQEISVNNPLRRAGFRFYQNSYDPEHPRVSGGYTRVTLALVDSTGKELSQLTLAPGVETPVPGDTVKITAGKLLPHFKLGQQGAYSEDAQFVNPALQITARGANGFTKQQWLFQKFPSTERGMGRYAFQVKGFEGQTAAMDMATIFEIKKTHGGWILWLGFIACTIGLVLCFYVNHRVLYVEWPDGARAETRLTGLTRKTIHLYTRQIDTMLAPLGGTSPNDDNS